ncbi:MAG: hypothetical protein JKY69_04685, partial [Flavobacteriaceae bacterium]|nr:hypothetical protein [Flavobacteriaceae bacterium]
MLAYYYTILNIVMKKILFILVVLCFGHVVNAQHSEQYYLSIINTTNNKELKLAALDSLIQKNKNTNIPAFTNYSEQYINLAIELKFYEQAIKKTIRSSFGFNVQLGQGGKALELLQKVEKFKDKTNNPFLLGSIYLKKGGVYFNGNDYHKAIKNYTLAIEAYSSNDSIFTADAIFFRGKANFEIGAHISAIDDFKLAAAYYQNLKDTNYFFQTQIGIVNIYDINGFHKKAIAERKKIIRAKKILKINQNLYLDYYNQGYSYKKLGNSGKQEESLLKA